MDAATLEWSIRHLEGATYSVDTRFWPAGSTSDAQLVTGMLPRIALDPQALLPLLSDPQAYGAALTSRLFADERLRVAFRTARASAETAAVPLRILLRLDASDSTIHGLAWETLQDVERGGFLFQSERVLLARLLDSPDLTPLTPRPRGTVRALILVAHPSGLEDYGLARIDVTGEIARCRTALGAIPLTVLARESSGQAVSLANLRAALRDEPDILYLVAHGTHRDGQPYLWLEHDDGTIDRVAGHEFARSLAELPRRPLLVVLASCQSGGQSHDDGALAAVGPQLAVAGVGAVLGMQGNVTMDTVAGSMPVFFRELLRDGQIDRALAAARATVQGRFDWWLPVLWLRLRDGELWAAAPDKEAVSPAALALHQLRAPVGDFVGRAAEIAKLVQAARGGAAAAISGVRGMGGIGKTELAYVVAHQLASDFPDAQIVVDLRGVSDPLSPIQALQTAIRAFEREAKLPDDLAELQAIYRSLLSGKHILVLADDARNTAQIRPLLPPPGSALLITSRYRFTLPGMHTIDLGILAAAEAEALLLTICPRIAGAASALAKLCGYLPLALRISAGVLASDATLSVTRYLEQLADERQRLAALRDEDDPTLNVDASLALSYTALSPLAQTVFCQLSVFVADFDLAAAQAVVELGQPLEPLLGDLYRRSLLDYDAAQERYSLHDLVKVFAQNHLETAAREPLMLRYARHYAQLADRADRLYLQGGEQVALGLGLFDRERRHIDAGWQWARGQAAEPAIDALLIDFAGATAHIGDLRYDVRQERIPQLEAALAGAERAGRLADQGWLLNNLGNAYRNLGEVRRAIDSYEQSLLIKREVGDRRGEGQTLGNLGNAYRNLGEVRRAIDFYEQDLAITREVGDRRGEGNALNNLGNAYSDLGEVRRAIDSYEQSLLIKREVGDRRGEGNALNNLGLAYSDLGEVRRAIDSYEQSLLITREMGDRRGEGQTLNNLGLAYSDLGEVRRAIDFYEQRLVIAREIGDRQGEAIGSWNLGDLLVQQGDLARAVELMQRCVDYELSIGHTDAEADAAQVEALRAQLQAAEGAISPEGATPAEDPPA